MLIVVSILYLAAQARSQGEAIISVQIIASGGPPVAGESYNLTCNVSGSVGVTRYKWMKESNPYRDETNKILTFPSIHLCDAGNYTCEVIVEEGMQITSDNLIIEPQNSSSTLATVNITSTVSNIIHSVGSNVTLICNIKLSEVVDVPVIVNTVWTGPNGFMANTTMQSNIEQNICHDTIQSDTIQSNTNVGQCDTQFTCVSRVTVTSFTRDNSGLYNCSATILALHPYLTDFYIQVSNGTTFTTGVYLSFNGEFLRNGSSIPYIEISRNSSAIEESLVCHTDKVDCCKTSNEGDWYLPDGSDKFGVIRSDEGKVGLYRTTDILSSTSLRTLCCTVPNADDTNQTVCVNSAFSVSVNEAAPPIVGQNYTLFCNTTGENITSYKWKRDDVEFSEMGSILRFPVDLSHAGTYSCIINDSYIGNKEVTIQIPAPDSVNLHSNKINPIWPDGSDVILNCTVELNPAVINANFSLLTVHIQLTRNEIPLNITSTATTGTTFTYTTQLTSFGRNDSGNYTCTVTIRSLTPHLNTSSSVTNSTKITTGAYLSLTESHIANNSDIYISTIGEEPDQALLCLTDFYQFFNRSEDFGGQWYFPNGSAVTNDSNHGMYMSRGLGVVRLHRRNNILMPTETFRCDILDSDETNQTIYVNVLYLHEDTSTSSSLTTTVTLSNGTVDSDVIMSEVTVSELTMSEVTMSEVTMSEVTVNEVSVSGAAVGGTVSGGLLLIIAGTVLAILVMIWRLRRQSKQSKYSHHARGFPESLEAIDSTKLPLEPDICVDGRGECIELKECGETQTDDSENHFIDMTPIDGECMRSISVSEFCNHVERLQADRDNLFEVEYTRLSRLPKFCTSEAKLPYNIPKNRFVNILPYDCSRVKLREIDGEEGSDYINANYLDGYNKPTAYIAAQGPLPNTVGDFWRMIWENKLSTIVMLTRCFEGRAKCEEYWPVNIGESVNPGHDLTITLTATLPIHHQKNESHPSNIYSNIDLPLEVVQFHFTGWPDHGVPQNGVVLINFIRRIRIIHPYSDPCPLLVHCSAGVGRTGAFIVLDSMLERMKKENSLNIFEFLKQIRAQRVLMVQTQSQYNFIHDVLNELILSGDTEINALNLRIIMNRLNKIRDGETGYSKQFKILDHVSPTPCEADFNHANMECNIGKNRYPHIRPNDHYRVVLQELAGSGLDYINASFIDGYRQRGTYIATQIPMENTVNDFWKMVWEYKSKSIVVLCKLTEEGETYHGFLPETKGNSLMYGKVQVKFISQKIATDYIIKQVELSEDRGTDKHEAMTVTVFHYLRWPKSGSPQRTASLLEVIEQVNKKQMSTGNKAITVMCNDGVGRTGTFICIHAQLERLKTEGVVDFFQSIKSVRIQRAGLVPDVHQYVLCHTVVADFLDDFDAYANFKELI